MSSIKQLKQGLVMVMVAESPLLGDTTEELQKKIEACIEAGELHLIINFQSIPFVDSKALEMLLTCSRLARHKGGALKVAQPNDVCKDIFVATRLRNTLEIYPDISTALRSFL